MQHAKLVCSCEQILWIFSLQGVRDRSIRSGKEMAREIQLTDWSTAGNLSKRYLYSAKSSWIIMLFNFILR